MSASALGYQCPGCGSDGEHHIHDWGWAGDTLLFIRLSCHTCESVWVEDLI